MDTVKQLILEADRQSVGLARNQARPQLDTSFLYRWNGLEGRTPTGAHLSTGPGEFTDWSLGVNFSVPLGLRQGRADLRRADPSEYTRHSAGNALRDIRRTWPALVDAETATWNLADPRADFTYRRVLHARWAP